MTYFATFIFFVLTITICFLSNETSAQGKRPLKALGTKVCSTDTFARVNLCCKFPKLLPYAAFETCMGEIEAIAKKSAQRKRPSKAKSGGLMANLFSATSGKKAPRRQQLPGGATCLMECVLRNQKLLMSSGDINNTAINDKFSSEAGDTWQSLVLESATKCEAELQKIDPKSLVPIQAGSDTKCKPQPAMLLSCVRRYLFLGCPRNERRETKELNCAQRMEELKSCDPFTVATTTTPAP